MTRGVIGRGDVLSDLNYDLKNKTASKFSSEALDLGFDDPEKTSSIPSREKHNYTNTISLKGYEKHSYLAPTVSSSHQHQHDPDEFDDNRKQGIVQTEKLEQTPVYRKMPSASPLIAKLKYSPYATKAPPKSRPSSSQGKVDEKVPVMSRDLYPTKKISASLGDLGISSLAPIDGGKESKKAGLYGRPPSRQVTAFPLDLGSSSSGQKSANSLRESKLSLILEERNSPRRDHTNSTALFKIRPSADARPIVRSDAAAEEDEPQRPPSRQKVGAQHLFRSNRADTAYSAEGTRSSHRAASPSSRRRQLARNAACSKSAPSLSLGIAQLSLTSPADQPSIATNDGYAQPENESNRDTHASQSAAAVHTSAGKDSTLTSTPPDSDNLKVLHEVVSAEVDDSLFSGLDLGEVRRGSGDEAFDEHEDEMNASTKFRVILNDSYDGAVEAGGNPRLNVYPLRIRDSGSSPRGDLGSARSHSSLLPYDLSNLASPSCSVVSDLEESDSRPHSARSRQGSGEPFFAASPRHDAQHPEYRGNAIKSTIQQANSSSRMPPKGKPQQAAGTMTNKALLNQWTVNGTTAPSPSSSSYRARKLQGEYSNVSYIN